MAELVMAKAVFEVSLNIPEGVSRQEMAWYIQDAVSTWKGSLHPDSALFELDRYSVKVTDRKERKKYYSTRAGDFEARVGCGS